MSHFCNDPCYGKIYCDPSCNPRCSPVCCVPATSCNPCCSVHKPDSLFCSFCPDSDSFCPSTPNSCFSMISSVSDCRPPASISGFNACSNACCQLAGDKNLPVDSGSASSGNNNDNNCEDSCNVNKDPCDIGNDDALSNTCIDSNDEKNSGCRCNSPCLTTNISNTINMLLTESAEFKDIERKLRCCYGKAKTFVNNQNV